MNTGGDGGAGLGQITDPKPNMGDLWDWMYNMTTAGQIMIYRRNLKIERVYRFASDILKSYRDVLQSAHPGKMIISGYDLNKIILDVFRGYNGFRGNQRYSGVSDIYLHEFEPVFERPGLPHVRISGNTASIVWRQIPWSERNGENTNQRKYVCIIMNMQPGCGHDEADLYYDPTSPCRDGV